MHSTERRGRRWGTAAGDGGVVLAAVRERGGVMRACWFVGGYVNPRLGSEYESESEMPLFLLYLSVTAQCKV